jgi:hypothetical protein
MNETPEHREYREAIQAAEERFRNTLKAPGSEICVQCGAPMRPFVLGSDSPSSSRSFYYSADMRHPSVHTYPELAGRSQR